MASIQSIDETHLEAVCSVLGDAEGGLTGTEIDRYLQQCGIDGSAGGSSKRARLFEALKTRQRSDRCSNNVLAFIQKVMSPSLYHSRHERFSDLRSRLNRPLAFAGFKVSEAGKIVAVTPATTIGEAQERADKLQSELLKRRVHPDVLKFCRSELLQQNYFHAVLEATKSVSEKIRLKTGLTGDAGELANKAFSLGQHGMPYLAFNALTNDTEKGEQSGLMNLFIGMFGTFRNVTAHGAKITWKLDEQDALDLLTLVSLLHRRLDAAVRTPRI